MSCITSQCRNSIYCKSAIGLNVFLRQKLLPQLLHKPPKVEAPVTPKVLRVVGDSTYKP